MLRHEPQEFDEKSVFEGKVYTEHAQFFSKAANAKMHGARGVILIERPPGPSRAKRTSWRIRRRRRARDAGIPFVQIKKQIAERWFAAAGKNLDEIEAGIDQDSEAALVRLPGDLAGRGQRGCRARW